MNGTRDPVAFLPPQSMSFREATRRLGIEDYSERIFYSNSHGELMHIFDYIHMATKISGDVSWFRTLFVACVEMAEAEWERSESCFQHMPRLMYQMAKGNDATAP